MVNKSFRILIQCTVQRLICPVRPDSARDQPPMNCVEKRDLLPSAHGHPRNVVISIPIPPPNSPTSIDLCAPSSFKPDDLLETTNYSSRLAPNVTFHAQWPIVASSCFAVFLADQIMHTDTAPLSILVDEPPQGTGFLHSTPLVPAYWNTILDSAGEIRQPFMPGFS
jgi:hypothetical protein